MSKYNILYLFKFLIVFLWLTSEALAESNFITISGALPPLVKKGEKPYLITSTVEVKEGEEVIIEKGAVFLFKNFTGLNVMGTIVVKGTKKDPVIFTSENDTFYNTTSTLEPAPFDWDGITVNPGMEKNIFEHCSIKYSLFGIKSLTQNITLTKCSFEQNGSADFTINEEKKEVSRPFYSFPSEEEEAGFTVDVDTPASDIVLQKVEEEKETEVSKKLELDVPEEDKKKRRKKEVPLVTESPRERKGGKVVVRMLSLTTTFAGIAGGVVQYMDYKSAKEEFNKLDDPNSPENLMNPNIREDWENAKNNVNEHQKLGYIYGGVALLGVAVFAITFAF
ncbi:hypothetical protein ACFL5S_00945 [Fibrobacterota bacterium]